MSVQVAVRVRPFNNREIELGSELCVEMSGRTTTLINLEDPKKNRDFSFDFSFWSHSGFELDSEGKSVSIDGKYSDQQEVYDLVGSQMLDNAWLGYHCCLLAYGQTGAGKSYSMIGYKPNRGIVPIACEEIFKRISANEQSAEYEVYFSMLEIYNERVQDLLISPSKRPQGGLRIRENKTIGFYVEHLSKYPVNSYETIESRMEEGSKNRTIASTQMNASSSRAHTIITIEFRKREMIEGRKIEKYSQINLVDLAGSEKVGKTGATGDRLKEAGQINKSLHILGLVIMTLAEVEGGKKTKVPYRDSCLTRILCNALGGNSKTLMICAISPSNDNFDETLSTLRYADQAKRIKNRAIINETAVDKLIRELTQENQKLKSTIQELRSKILLNPALSKKEIEELEDEIQAMDDLMNDMQITHEQRVQDTKQFDEFDFQKDQEEQEFQISTHLSNLNEDPQLNNKIKFKIDNDTTYVGRKTAIPPPEIILDRVGIREKHAIFMKIQKKVFLAPYDEDCQDLIYLNGEIVVGQKQIFHRDRIVFGTNSTFLVFSPDLIERPGQNLPKEIDWEFAQDEISKQQLSPLNDLSDIDQKEQDLRDQMAEKLRNFELERESERQMYKSKIKNQINNYEHKLIELGDKMKEESEKQRLEKEQLEYERASKEIIAKLEAERIQKELEREKQKQALERQEQHRIFKLTSLRNLEARLQRVSRKTFEVGFIAKELKRDFTFTPIISYMYVDASEVSSSKSKEPKINILVKNLEDGYEYEWDLEKFQSRNYLIKELLNKYFETNEIPKVLQSEDPFWDPPEPSLIGQGYIKLVGLANGLDLQTKIKLVNNGVQVGSLEVGFSPCNIDGSIEYDEDNCSELAIDDPNDLLNRRLDFKIKIWNASLPLNFSTDTFVEYQLMYIDGSQQPTKFRSIKISGKNAEPNYAYSGQHTYKNIQPRIIQYLSNSTIQFCVYGFDDARIQQMKEAQLRQEANIQNKQLNPAQTNQKKSQENKQPQQQQRSQNSSKINESPKKTGILKIEQQRGNQKVSELAFPLTRISSSEQSKTESITTTAHSDRVETEPALLDHGDQTSQQSYSAPRKRVSSLDNSSKKNSNSKSSSKNKDKKKNECTIF